MDFVAARDIASLRPANLDRCGARGHDALGGLDGGKDGAFFLGRRLYAVDLVEIKRCKGLNDGAFGGLRLAGVLVGAFGFPRLIEDAMRAVLALLHLPAHVGRLFVRQPKGGGVPVAKAGAPKDQDVYALVGLACRKVQGKGWLTVPKTAAGRVRLFHGG